MESSISSLFISGQFLGAVSEGFLFTGFVCRLESRKGSFDDLRIRVIQKLAVEFQLWALFALESGYYDQAHFISDFKDLTGATPTNLFGRKIR